MTTLSNIAPQAMVPALATLCLAVTACVAPTIYVEEAPPQAAAPTVETSQPTDPPTDTPEPPTDTPEPTDTLAPATDVPEPPTDTPVSPTDTPEPPTDTPVPPTDTPAPPTDTPEPTSDTSPAEAYVMQGFEYLNQEKWDAALAEFDEAIRLDPEFGYAYMGLGYAHAFGPGDLRKAIENLETYLKLVPDAENRAEVEADIQEMRDFMASQLPPSGPCCPAMQSGKGLLWVENFVGEPVQADIGTNLGTQFYEIPAKQGDVSGCFCLEMDPGQYIIVVKTFTHEGRFDFEIVEDQTLHFPLRYRD